MRLPVSCAAVLGAALAGCATVSSMQPAPYTELLAERGLRQGTEVDRIPAYRNDGWTQLDPEHLIITSGAASRYLVSFAEPCNGTSEALLFKTRTGDLTRYDRVYLNADAVPTPCFIDRLHLLEPLDPPAG